MKDRVLGGAGSTFDRASSTSVTRAACSAATTSSTLSRPWIHGRAPKLEVVTPRRAGPVAPSRAGPRIAASGTPAPTILPNSRREIELMGGSSRCSARPTSGTAIVRDYNPAVVSARKAVLVVLGLAASATLLRAGGGSRQGAPACPVSPVPTISSRMPADVCIPDGFTGIAVDYFDDYSWRAFIALVWPAATGHRGEAQSASSLSTGGPRVFDTYKPLWEIFHSDGSAPEPAFDRYEIAAHNPCGVTHEFGDVTVGSASGIDDIGQAGIGVLDPPIVAQNGRYVRTLTFFNKIAFDHIVRNRFYLRS